MTAARMTVAMAEANPPPRRSGVFEITGTHPRPLAAWLRPFTCRSWGLARVVAITALFLTGCEGLPGGCGVDYQHRTGRGLHPILPSPCNQCRERRQLTSPARCKMSHQGGPYWYGDRMKHIRISTVRALVVTSFVVGALAFVPDVTFAAPNCNLNRTLVRANLAGCAMALADLRGEDLSGANLSDAILINADLSGADLSGANLRGALIIHTSLFRANLTGADLRGAIVDIADLTGADLTSANLSDAKLRGTIIVNANLTGTDLTGTDMTGAVRRSGISRADLMGAKGLDFVTGLED